MAKGGQHHSNISNCDELTKEVAAECRATSTPCLEMSQPSHHHHELIHPKSEQIGGDLLLSTEKLAEKVRISGRQDFATKCVYHENVMNFVTK